MAATVTRTKAERRAIREIVTVLEDMLANRRTSIMSTSIVCVHDKPMVLGGGSAWGSEPFPPQLVNTGVSEYTITVRVYTRPLKKATK